MPRPRKVDEAGKYASVVKEMIGNGTSQRNIARSLGISQSTVSRLLASAPVTGTDILWEGIKARDGYRDAAQARHDAFHAGDVRLVEDLTRRLSEIEGRPRFSGHRWSDRGESDELCKFFRHGDNPW